MTGAAFIDSTMFDCGKYQVLTQDTVLRAIILDWANRVCKDISGAHRHFNWLEKTASFPTVVDQMTYDLPTDIDLSGRKVFNIRQKDSPTRLKYIDQNRLDELEPDPESTGNPIWYTLWANQVRLYPIPSAVITMYMRYIKTITALTDSTSSTTDIPSKWDEVVLDGIKVHAFRMFPQWGNSAEQKIIYEQGKAKMVYDNDNGLDVQNITERHYDTNLIREPWSFNNENMQ